MFKEQVNDFSLKGLRCKEIRNMTVGIMRTGRIGQQVMKDLSGFGCGEYGRLRRDRDLLNGAGTEL
ncbi:MAG: hypothetical protein HFI50_14005 [Lachnospiraceae bacterium]|nr:hypothetical protein [Lachnospiraceae bacterium]